MNNRIELIDFIHIISFNLSYPTIVLYNLQCSIVIEKKNKFIAIETRIHLFINNKTHACVYINIQL